MRAAKRFLGVLLTLCTLLSLLPNTVLAANRNILFADVTETDWFYDAVDYVYKNGMMSGTGNNQFSPDMTTTRGMIVTVLYRMAGSPVISSISFNDVVAGEYYANGVCWAAQNGVVSGYGNGLFGPNDPITREQLATILYRYAKYKEYETTVVGDVSFFLDGTMVSNYAIEAMNWAVSVGLLSGVGNNILNPAGTATRAEIATVLMRFCNLDIVSPIESHTVIFDYNYDNKGVYEMATVNDCETVDKPMNPTRDGYTFAGWYTNSVGSKKFSFDTKIIEDITLYAKWDKKSSGVGKFFVVTFNSNGGSAVTSQTVQKGEYASQPAAPIKDGFIFDGWYLDVELTVPYSFTSSGVTEDVTLYAKWRKESTKVPEPNLKIDMSNFSYSNEADWYVIADEVNQLSGSLEASASVRSLSLSINDAKGNLLLSAQVPVAETWTASDVGFVVGENTIIVTADCNGMPITDEVKVFNMNKGNMKNLDIDGSDMDQDGLSNYWEQYYGTDVSKVDTDSDGLTDYFELYISNTSPLKSDTDGDGVSDAAEDFDNDDVTNLVESQKFGDPYLEDTDGDGLSDAEEVQYSTTLNLSDTDSDGVSDYLEVKILHTDPLQDEGEGSRSFTYSKNYETNATVQPVVKVTAPGNALESLKITPVDTKNGLLTSSLPGFIGQGYDIVMDGTFSSATVQFKIDDALFDSQNFVPAVYYYDEEAQQLERVENQRVEGHQVVAELEHFSSYIVLNEAKYIGVMGGGGKYDEIAQTDSDKDGLPDFLENNGIIMQNGLYFYTLANNPDSDGDGLDDGEEIIIQVDENGSWRGIMYSNPNLKDSDGDGVNDEKERKRGSSPMHSDMKTADVERLLDNELYASSIFRSDFDSSALNQFLILSNSAVSENWNYSLIYKKMLLDFFEEHAEELYEVKLYGAYNVAIDAMVNWIATANSTASTSDPEKIRFIEEKLREAKKIQSQIGDSAPSTEDVSKALGYCGDIFDELGKDIPADLKLTIGGLGVGTTLGFSSEVFGAISKIDSVIQTYARIDANAELLRDHSDILNYISRYTSDMNLKAAAKELMLQVNAEVKNSFMVRDELINITSVLTLDMASSSLSQITGTAGTVLKAIDDITDWLEISKLPDINRRGVEVLGYAGSANAVANGMKKDGLTTFADYTPVTNKAVYDLYALLLLRWDAEKSWNDALPYRSTSKPMEDRYDNNIKFLKEIKYKYKSGEYGFFYGSFSASPRQGVCGYVNFPPDVNIEVYAYEDGHNTPCAADYTKNGKFFLSLDDGTYDIRIVSAGYEDYLLQNVEVETCVASVGTISMELEGLDPGEELTYETFDLYANEADDQFQAVLINNSILTILGHTDSRAHSRYGISNKEMNTYFLVPIDETTGAFGLLNPSEESWNYLNLSYFPDGKHIFYFVYLDDSNEYMYMYTGRPMVIEIKDGEATFVKTKSLAYNEQMLKDLNSHNLSDFLIPEEHEFISEKDMQVIRAKAEEITAGISDDYHKAKAIYEWVCENITYDVYTSGDPQKQLPQTVLNTGKAICDGYAQITQALLISIDIPCAFITGYSPGNNTDYLDDDSSLFGNYSNHAWNAAYIDGRWVLIETTWGNQIVNDHLLLGDFDTHLDAFTMLHRYDQIGRNVITVENMMGNEVA